MEEDDYDDEVEVREGGRQGGREGGREGGFTFLTHVSHT